MANTRKHIKILKKWIKNEGDDTKLPKRYKINHKKWGKLLKTKLFKDEISGRFEVAKKRSQLLMAKYLPLATAKLIEQCNSDNNETSRKACLEIIELCADEKPIEIIQAVPVKKEPDVEMDDETASKILEVMAESKKTKGIENRF